MDLNRIIMSFVFIMVLSNFVSASYISGELKIDERGIVIFNAETDIPLNIEGLELKGEVLTGRTNTLTSKSGSKWTFHLQGNEYDDIFLDVILPRGTKRILSIEGNRYLFDTDEKTTTIIDSGKLDFEITYEIEQTNNYSYLASLFLLILLILIVYLVYRHKKKRDKIDYVMPLINENEQKIVEILMKGQMRQREVRKKLDLPKASFSRYIINLEKKKLLVREGDGKNKILRLK